MADQQVLRTGQPLTIQVSVTLANGEVRWFQTRALPPGAGRWHGARCWA